jgi:antitoxin component YwqK of YwqJK toxin-antitoxin module
MIQETDSSLLISKLPRLSDPLLEQEGLVLEKDEEGRIRAAYLTTDGLKHGESRLFYPDGKIKANLFYDRGILHGPSFFYSEAQVLLTETLYVQGKKEGKVHYFYLSGKLASLQRFREGIPYGLQEYWYENGIIKSSIPYEQGAIHGEVRLFWESGQLKRCVQYAKGAREGWDRLWNEKGILIEEGEFRAGHPIHSHCHFFSDGQKKEELFYHTPLRFDVKQWDASGTLLREGVYASDLSYTERTFEQPQKTIVRKGYWDGQRLCWK